jgi:dTDP-4-dehydrorhamnose 3,5-epimerase-like enzyme
MNREEVIYFPKISDARGNLTFLESNKHVPFTIQRVYWIYDVPGGEIRGSHAFHETHELIIALSGSFDIKLDDGEKKEIVQLNRSYYGLHIPAKRWRQMLNFSTNALALVVSSTKYDKNDYIRDYEEFLKIDKTNNSITPSINTNSSSTKKYYISNTSVNECKEVNLDIIHRDRGNITVVENNLDIDFATERVYYLYDIPGGEERGGHAHKQLRQLIIAASGSFDVELNDGKNKKTINLNRSYNCLEIVPGIWRELKNFSSGSICLVLASEKYDETDYIRNFNEFLRIKKNEIFYR